MGWGVNMRAGAVALSALLSLSGCTADNDDEDIALRLPDSSDARYRDASSVGATERGLVAAIVTTLDGEDFQSAGYVEGPDTDPARPGDRPAPKYVSVTLRDGTMIDVSVGQSWGAALPCDVNPGQIECDENPYRFIGADDAADDADAEEMPSFGARTDTAERGHVSIQLWTDRSRDDAEDILRALIDAPTIAVRTTAGLNALGEGLELDELELESEYSEVPP